jgi:hypothetical protein
MEVGAIIALITAALKFPEAVLAIVKLFEKVPQEKHEDLLKDIAKEAEKFDKDGRPTWT